jgi:hypothetical protein
VNYFYVVYTINDGGLSGSNSLENTTVLPPPAPTGFFATAGNMQAALSWTASSGAEAYNVKRSATSGGPYTTISSVGATSAVDLGLSNLVTYYYVISAVNDGGESANSAEASVMPGAWSNQDIGTVGVAGSVSSSGTTFTIKGSGADIWDSADGFRYMDQLISGDCIITTRVATLQNVNAWSKAGVMIRETLAANSANAAVVVTPGSGVSFQWRTSTGGASSFTSTVGLSAPYWVRIVRSGNTFSGFRSSDGQSWTSMGTPVTIPMATSVYIGLAVTSHNNSTACTATFDNVSILPPVPTGLSATVVGGQVGLTWAPSIGTSTYHVQRATVSGGPYTTLANPAAASYTDTTAAAGSTYYYVVSAVNSGGETANSAEATGDLTPPVITVPGNLVVLATGTGGAVVSFTSSALDDVSGSRVTTNTPVSGSIFPVGVTTVTVTAADAVGNMASKTFTVTVNLQTPTGLSAVAVSDTQIRLTWTNNASYSSACAVERSLQGANTWMSLTTTLPGNSVTYTDASAIASTSYDYRIQCLLGSGSSAFATVTATTPAALGDGIAGSWRLQYFGNGLSNAGSAAAGADPDGDGMTNLQEYFAGTNPLDRASVFRISAIAKIGNDIGISFPSVSGKSYAVEKTTSLASGTWVLVQDNIAGTNAVVSVTDSGAATQPRRFYHVILK